MVSSPLKKNYFAHVLWLFISIKFMIPKIQGHKMNLLLLYWIGIIMIFYADVKELNIEDMSQQGCFL